MRCSRSILSRVSSFRLSGLRFYSGLDTSSPAQRNGHAHVGRKFTKDHEWIDIGTGDSSRVATVGITDYAQRALGDLVYVELPKVDIDVAQQDLIGVVESVKGASDVYAPVSGKVVGANESVAQTPSLINKSPMDKGWICKIRLANTGELDSLMEEKAYEKYCLESE